MRLYMACVLASLITAQAHAQDITQQKYPPPGKLIDIGGRKLHLFCEGKGSPTVILMAGGGGFSFFLALPHAQGAQNTEEGSSYRAGKTRSEPRAPAAKAEQNIFPFYAPRQT